MSDARTEHPTRLEVVFVTDIGSKRQKNQDNGSASASDGYCLIADGMGGHKGGETASRLAVEHQAQAMLRANFTPDATPQQMMNGLQAAHRAIHRLSHEREDLRGMGTTSTMLAVDDTADPRRAWITQVGDSRCYLARTGAIWQLTRDHSMVQERLRAGLITREQLRTDSMKNVITRSVGYEATVEPDLYELTPRPGDLFLLCSDGLTGQLEDFEILDELDRYRDTRDWDACARQLIALANKRGGDDNISVGILHILPKP